MKKQGIIFFIVCFTVLSSCKKDEDPVATPTENTDYGQLKEGNYWVYEEFDIDSVGNATPTGVYDSCFIYKDTLINGNTYFEMHRPGTNIINPISYIRDSLSYIVNSSGKIIFSSSDFSTTFNTDYSFANPGDTILKVTSKMADKNMSVNTPAGTFITSNFKLTYNIYPSWVMYYSTMHQNTRYAKDIGIVTETLPLFLGSVFFKERRLVRYRVN